MEPDTRSSCALVGDHLARSAAIACMSFSVFVNQHASAEPWIDFDVIADTSMSPPNYPGLVFYGFSDANVRISNGAVYLSASAFGENPFEDNIGGYYEWDNGLLREKFNDRTQLPDAEPGPRSSFGDYDINDDVFVFAGSSSGITTGVYGIINDVVVKVIDNYTPITNSSLTLDGVGRVQTDGENVVFQALLQDGPGGGVTEAIMSATIDGQNLRVLVDENTPFPGQTQPLRDFSNLGGFENGRLVFHAADNPPFEIGTRRGVFSVDLDANVRLVADFNTPQPGTGLDFGFFTVSEPAITGDTAAFAADNAEGIGIYGADLVTGEIFTIVDDETAYPDLPGQQTTIMVAPSLDGDNLAFTAAGLDDRFPGIGFHAIMMQIDGEIHRVLGKGDMFQGREVSFLRMNSESFEGQSVVFFARFTDGFEGVYMATLIPTPGASVVLASLGFISFRRRR